jgi:hypothetical protein
MMRRRNSAQPMEDDDVQNMYQNEQLMNDDE